MQTHNLGYPRIGCQRELKKACESYWAGQSTAAALLQAGKHIRLQNWKLQQEAGIDLIPCNDFSFYDHVLDMSLTAGAIPRRYLKLMEKSEMSELDLLFSMARGYQKDGLDATAMEMTKWFDTNYHYIVPEFYKDQQFKLFSKKIEEECKEALSMGIKAKPVLVGPVSYLLLGKEKEAGFHRLDLLKNLLPVYMEILSALSVSGVEWMQFDEPFLAMDLSDEQRKAFLYAYSEIKAYFPQMNILLATYFGGLEDNMETALSLPVDALHVDLARSPRQLDELLKNIKVSSRMSISLGAVDGRNIWKNDFATSIRIVEKALSTIGSERVMFAPSCSLLHVPCDLEMENKLDARIVEWLSFAKQKIDEVATIKKIIENPKSDWAIEKLKSNRSAMESRRTSKLIHNEAVERRVKNISDADARRANPFSVRKPKQQQALRLPLFPTTTIGSFPQTTEVRGWRAKFKKGELTLQQYQGLLEKETEKTIRFQEEIGIDVLVHGEFERNDMVEYFGEQLAGFVFTKNGWVQSYGSRCVKPPIIYGDVYRVEPMTTRWSAFAQSIASKPVKGMLTGPVTILQWSFVRNDQPTSATCAQIALAIRDEVVDLEKAGIKIIQIDEPAIREGLPLRKKYWKEYLDWAIQAFRLSACGVSDETQIHTHMCYSEFNDIIQNIADMDADVITIECSRSQMKLLNAFADFNYPNDIGPGVFDIHSPRVPSVAEMIDLLEKAKSVIPARQLWVNPDCGLKTRKWEETRLALVNMVAAAKAVREQG